jgi:cleavage and polyadenylation specificity factor subunit 3
VTSSLSLTVLGGAREIGANSVYLGLGGDQGVLLDAGLHPKRHGRAALPDFDAAPGDVEEILISHAHLDHVGALPAALHRFPRSRVYMSGPTSLLAVRMLRNAVSISRSHAASPADVLYGDSQVEWVEQVLRTQEPGHTFALGHIAGEAPKITFFSSGHLLGACGVLVEHRGRRLFYSGDTCATAQQICSAARYPRSGVDVLLLECTHGADADSELAVDQRSFERARRELASFICTVAERGGSLLIPVFALGRAQEILGVLHALVSKGSIPALPIYTSGLAHAINRIYDATRTGSERRQPELRLEDTGYRLLDPERDGAALHRPSILAVTSGMMYPSTSSHTLASAVLPEPKHGIAFVGYLDPDSPGHRVAHAAIGETVDLGGDAGPVRVACSVRHLGFTAHSRASQLLKTVADLRPERVVLVHGESDSAERLAHRLHATGVDVTIAEPGVTLDV